MAAHARLSPSSASRWLRCAASVGFIDEADLADESGVPAKEGTILHAFCEKALRESVSPYSFVGQIGESEGHTLEITDDMAEQMLAGLDVIGDIPGKLFIEKRLDLGRWMPGQFGTMDVGIAGRKVATVFDWKWGYTPVDAVDNDQGKIYGLGFWDNFARHISNEIRKVRIIIFQPRAPGGGGEWEIHIDDLLQWGEDLKRMAEATYDPEAPFVPGSKQCSYCPGAKTLTCDAYKKWNLEGLMADFDDLDEEIEMGIPMRMPSKTFLTPERRSHLLANRPALNKFLDRLAAEELDDALKGRLTPGRKPVEGRMPPRKWVDVAAAEREVTLILPDEEAYSRKLISPTQLEKAVPESTYNRLAKTLIERGEAKVVMVPEEDRRPRVADLRSEFDD
jgi:hypothetical protein